MANCSYFEPGVTVMKDQLYKDKVVVVTGAASGIGLAICRRFAMEGSKIGLLDMDGTAVRACEKAFIEKGIDAVGLQCDVSSEDDCDSAIKKIIMRYGGIDVLVNNAGITQRGAFIETQASVYRKVMDVNFFGALHCTKASMDSLMKRKGLIIIIESIAGVSPLPGRTGYCASKYALHGLFSTLRTEMKPSGMHVMLVCPGFVRTNLQTRALGTDGRVTTRPQSRVGKQISPERVADAVYRAALKRRNIVVLPFMAKLGYWICRFSPILYERMMARMFQEELVGRMEDEGAIKN